jgi:hypothetical protein
MNQHEMKCVEMSKSKLLQHVEAKLLKLWGNRSDRSDRSDQSDHLPKAMMVTGDSPLTDPRHTIISGGFRMGGETTEKQNVTEIY